MNRNMRTTTKQQNRDSVKLKTVGGKGVRTSVNIDTGSLLEVMECREDVLKHLQERFAHIPSEVSLVDELIAERRAGAGEK